MLHSPDFKIFMVNKNKITKIVSTQARYLASAEEVSSFCIAHNLEPLLCTDRGLLLADASWMFGVETELVTCDNVGDAIVRALPAVSNESVISAWQDEYP